MTGMGDPEENEMEQLLKEAFKAIGKKGSRKEMLEALAQYFQRKADQEKGGSK